MNKWHEYKNAPSSGTLLCEAEEIGTNQAKEFRFGKSPFDFRMFVYNDNGTFRAFRNSCPHFDVPLNHEPDHLFTPDGQHFLCMTHHATFDKTTGACVTGPCENQGLDSIPLRQDGKKLVIA